MKPLTSRNRPEMLSIQEKASLTQGSAPDKTNPLPNGRALVLCDGPSGVRAVNEDGDSLSGVDNAKPSTVFPSLGSLARSFSQENFLALGKAIGEECRYDGVDVLLGPAINIQRNPLCGRNFEYCSEDPLLSGVYGAGFVKGVQEEGVAATPKHFACNGNENYRFVGDSVVSRRALEEIYLKGFQRVVEEAHPYAIMTAYNQVNHVFCSENPWLLQEKLRKEWGFDGFVMTDWGGTHDKILSIKNGCNLEMPGEVPHNVFAVEKAIEQGRLSEKELDISLDPLLKLPERLGTKAKPSERIFTEHEKLALSLALDSIVLLKNESGLLPLSKTENLLCVGPFFENVRYQGSGSSMLNPYFLSDFRSCFDSRGISYHFVRGFDGIEDKVDERLEKEALEEADKFETILFFGGMSDFDESEGFDKTSLQLRKNQASLLGKILQKGKKVILLLFTGTPIELGCFSRIGTIIDVGLSGEMEAEALTQILFGESNPCGKLAQTWPLSYGDTPSAKGFGKEGAEYYREDVFVGYRYFLSFGMKTAFPFGHGLSYTLFRARDFEIEEREEKIVFACKVKNEGPVEGKTVLQVYVNKPRKNSPAKELVAFSKIALAAGKEKRAVFSCSKKDLLSYDACSDSLALQEGKYVFYLGFSSEDIAEEADLTLDGLESPGFDIPLYGQLSDEEYCKQIGVPYIAYEKGKRPYTLETPIREFETWFGRIFCKAVSQVGYSQYKKARKIKDPIERAAKMKAGYFVYRLMGSNSLRSLCFSSSGAFTYKVALLILGMVNNRPIQGFKDMIREGKNHGKNK